MENNYENLLYTEARSPEKLKEQLKSISVPSTIMTGSWTKNGAMFGVWVVLDRPVKQMKKKDLKQKTATIEKTKEL